MDIHNILFRELVLKLIPPINILAKIGQKLRAFYLKIARISAPITDIIAA